MELPLGSSASAWFRFALAALAVWRLTHLLAREDGPWDLVLRLRRRLGSGLLGKMMDCFKCLSVWVALPFVAFVGGGPLEMLVCWPALSGAAILLEQQMSEPLILESETTAQETDDELLWTGPETAEDRSAAHRR